LAASICHYEGIYIRYISLYENENREFKSLKYSSLNSLTYKNVTNFVFNTILIPDAGNWNCPERRLQTLTQRAYFEF